MSRPRIFVLNEQSRPRCLDHVSQAPDGFEVMVSAPRMTGGQKARFHAICGDFARSEVKWAGKRRTKDEWKVLLISGHATATREEAEVVTGLESELVSIRESTTSMSRARGASLIDYATATATLLGVRLRGPEPPTN